MAPHFESQTWCFSCGKSMAQKKDKCSDCGSTLTSLIRIVVSSTRGFHSTLTTGLGNPSNLILLQDILNCLVQMTKQCLEDYRVPPDIGFSLLRYAEAFSSPGIFKQVFFAIDPEYSNDQFIRILKSKEPVSGTIRKQAMVALEAQIAVQMGYNISCAGGENLMVLLNVIQRIILSLKTSNHPTSLAFVDALRLQIEVHRVIGLAGHSDTSMVISESSEDQFYSLRCSCVIGFDLPKTVRSYVQSRGRARKNDSLYIIMLERDNKKQRDHLFDIIRSDHSMTDTSRNRDPDAWNLRACNFEDANRYYVEATGASVTPDSSVSLIYRYCEKLPRDRYIIPRPNCHFRLFGGMYQCETTLPSNAALPTIVGPMSRNTHLSKQLVCLEACEKLHQMGALDDHLLPLVEESLEIEHIMRSKESSAGAGTTKRKELHGTTCIRALSGTWGKKVDGASFEAYKFDFSCNVDESTYSGFVLLIESKLDDDVGNIEVDLYLIAKMVKASVSSCEKLHRSADQIKQAFCFQEFSFNGLFGRWFLGSEAEGTERKFLLQTETKSLWSSSYTFFLLPIGALDNSNKISWNIDWMRISSCANVVEFLRKHYSISLEDFKGRGGNILPSRTGSSMTDCKAEYLIHFVSIISAESPFEENVNAASSDYTDVEYFKTMYGIVLKYPGQPLLRLKQSHNPHNLFVDQERIIAAKVIDRYVKKLPCSSHFTASYLTGSTTSVDALAPKLQNSYYNTSPHGTTIYWMRLVTGIIVGVDSRSVVKYRANDPNNNREYHLLVSEIEEKFVPIMDGVFASLSGDQNRMHDMLQYVKTELNGVPMHIRHTIHDFVLVRDIAQKYFNDNPIIDYSFHRQSVIYISGWHPVEKRHIISVVGDEFKVANVVNSACFGTGSGHHAAIQDLEAKVLQNNKMKTEEAVQCMKNALLKSTLTDVSSGGDLKVYSLTGRKHELKYGGHIMEEMYKNPYLARIIFDERTLFVIFEMRHMDIMTPDDLIEHLKTFDSNVIFAGWLGYVGLHLGNSCLLIRVVFSQREFAVNWFESCDQWEGSLRRFLFSISDGRCCQCYLGFASSSLLAEARRMSSLDQLAKRMEIAQARRMSSSDNLARRIENEV